MPPESPASRRVSRRDLLSRSGAGFGALALAGLLGGSPAPGATGGGASVTHFAPRAKRVVFLFMNGGPSHVDTFDPKPALRRHEGEAPPTTHKKGNAGSLLPSPFEFRRHGASGVEMSELFPRLAGHADELCVLRSMHTDVPNHEPGLLLMHCGHQQPVRPCLGSWASYGLGSENQSLPGFVVLSPGRPVVGPQLWSSSFLPAEHQGTAVDTNDLRVDRLIANLSHPRRGGDAEREQLDLIRRLNELHRAERPGDDALDAQIRAMELAFAMQSEASEAFDVSREPPRVRELYGESVFGQSCLLARRLLERGVRFVEVCYVTKNGKQPWDTHSDNAGGHRRLCADSDRATAALLGELKERGLLDDTLVIWGGEFGRTPYAQIDKKNPKKSPGRDHHHTGFTTLLAGGGVRGGLTHGATDELGMHAIENRVHIHDLHATILHLLGMDHERLTYRYSGRDFRLTDVHGEVVHEILA